MTSQAPARATQSLLYRFYMRSVLWHFRRWWWWLWSGRECEDCGCQLALHRTGLRPGYRVLTVHHETYRRLGHERREDVALLCWPCHCRRQPWKARP